MTVISGTLLVVFFGLAVFYSMKWVNLNMIAHAEYTRGEYNGEYSDAIRMGTIVVTALWTMCAGSAVMFIQALT